MHNSIRFNVKNATILYRHDESIVLRLPQPAIHGDTKDLNRKPIPAGKYTVNGGDVWSNYYGQWIQVLHDGRYHDISVNLFEWYEEDQLPKSGNEYRG